MNKAASANLMGLYKAASEVKQAGKIMKVMISNMNYASKRQLRCMWPHYVYMPDCEKYRSVITGENGSEKAKLAQKFWLNLPPDIQFGSCDLEIVEK